MDVSADKARERGRKCKGMYDYEKKLQEELLEVVHKHHPYTGFDLGVQVKYMHAIWKASVSGVLEGFDEELLKNVQLYRHIYAEEEKKGRGKDEVV